MDTDQIVAELEAERDRLTEAIAALQGSRKGRGRGKGRKGRRFLTAAARHKISLAQKARWRKQKARS